MKLKQLMAVGMTATIMLTTGVGEVTAFAEDKQELTQELSENLDDEKLVDDTGNEIEKDVEESNDQKTQSAESTVSEEEKKVENQKSIESEEKQESDIKKEKVEEFLI